MPILTYPLPLASFWSGLRVKSARFWPGANVQLNATGGGEVIPASIGTRLWDGDVTLTPADDPGATEAILATLEEAGATFLAFPPKRAFPKADPTGAILGLAVPVIASLPAGGRSLTLSGLPAGYVLSAGDYLSFQRGTPIRHEFHRIVTPATADGSGVTPEFDVVPGIRPGVVVGAAVQLVRPYLRAVLVPGTIQPAPIEAGPAGTMVFSFRQTLAGA